MSVSFSVV